MAAMFRLVVPLAWTLLAAAVVQAGPVTTADPVYHGELSIRPAGGTINRRNGNATINIRNWTFTPTPQSDGVFPDQEPIIVALKDDNFRLEAGALHANRKGNTFTYRSTAKKTPRGVRLLKLTHLADGSWTVRLSMAGVDLSRLNLEDPICSPMAVIVGNDDGFGGVTITSPGWTSRRVDIPAGCDVGNAWPWINQ
jgi:hypothetical protein